MRGKGRINIIMKIKKKKVLSIMADNTFFRLIMADNGCWSQSTKD